MLSLFPVKTKSKLLLLSLRVAVWLCFSNQRYLKFCGLPTLQYGLYSIATSESETAKFQISLARIQIKIYETETPTPTPTPGAYP